MIEINRRIDRKRSPKTRIVIEIEAARRKRRTAQDPVKEDVLNLEKKSQKRRGENSKSSEIIEKYFLIKKLFLLARKINVVQKLQKRRKRRKIKSPKR